VRIYPSVDGKHPLDRFSNIEQDTKNSKKVFGVKVLKLLGDFTPEERYNIRMQYIQHKTVSKKIAKLTGYANREKAFSLICYKYQPHKKIKINIFTSLMV